MSKIQVPRFVLITDTASPSFPSLLKSVSQECQVCYPRHKFEVVDLKTAGWKLGGSANEQRDALSCELPLSERSVITGCGNIKHLRHGLMKLKRSL